MKIIFISQRVEVTGDTKERRDALSQEWGLLADACGFLPVPLPNNINIIKAMLKELPPSGIILTGGNDLASYGGDAPERDEGEGLLVDYALGKRIPLLGVCRGMQMLLDYFWVPLKRVEGHVRTVHILDNGKKTNSFHNFGTFCLPPSLKVLARSEDGCVEEFEHGEYGNIRGIMWHPERYSPLRQDDIEWIRRFFGI